MYDCNRCKIHMIRCIYIYISTNIHIHLSYMYSTIYMYGTVYIASPPSPMTSTLECNP